MCIGSLLWASLYDLRSAMCFPNVSSYFDGDTPPSLKSNLSFSFPQPGVIGMLTAVHISNASEHSQAMLRLTSND